MKFLIMQFYPTSSFSFSLSSKYSLQHFVFKHPQSPFFLQGEIQAHSLNLSSSFRVRDQTSHPYKKTR